MNSEQIEKPLVLVFDDEADFATALCAGLRLHGCDVEAFTHPDDAIRFVRDRLPDAAILDVMVDSPTCASSNDGITLYQNIRTHERNLRAKQLMPDGKQDVLIYFLTNAPKVDKRIEVLPSDVQDYLKKPALPHLLSARIYADLRRNQGADGAPETVGQASISPPAPGRMLVQGPLEIAYDRSRCTWNGEQVRLTPLQFEIVRELSEHAGGVRSREQLEFALAGSDTAPGESDLTSHIKRIRKAFHLVDPKFDRIETRYGVGYEWRRD